MKKRRLELFNQNLFQFILQLVRRSLALAPGSEDAASGAASGAVSIIRIMMTDGWTHEASAGQQLGSAHRMTSVSTPLSWSSRCLVIHTRRRWRRRSNEAPPTETINRAVFAAQTINHLGIKAGRRARARAHPPVPHQPESITHGRHGNHIREDTEG